MTEQSAPNKPVPKPPMLTAPDTPAAFSRDNLVSILLAAYGKHAAELLAIQASQEKLDNLVLGIYSAGLTLILTLATDAKTVLQTPDHTPSPFAWAFIAVAVMIGVYAIYMSGRRGQARQTVREALTQVEQALGFYEPKLYLKNDRLYRVEWLDYPKYTFLNWSVGIVIIVGLAFVAAIFFIAAAPAPP